METVPVVYEVGTKKYELAMNNESIERFESVSDMGIWDLFRQICQGVPPKHTHIQKLFWACVQSKNQAWTLKTAKEIVTPRRYPEVFTVLCKVLVDALADPEAKPEEGEPDKAAPLADGSTVSAG